MSAPAPTHDLSYYSKCMLGGALACGTTHTFITPLDVTKCNMQVSISILFSLSFVIKNHQLFMIINYW